MPRTRTRQIVLAPEELAELFKPARLEVYESLQVGGAATVAELAARLGRPADALYYHLRKLVEIGVVERRDEASPDAGEPGRNGVVYGSVAQTVTMRLDPASPASREAWAGGAASVLRLAERDARAALDSGEARTEGARRNLYVRRFKCRLTTGELKRINGLLDEVEEILREHAEGSEGRLHAVTLTMTPLEERAR